jgi:hypothetical protein
MSIPAFSGCTKGSYCSQQAQTPVGANKTGIYHRTVTTITGQGPAYSGSKTETYIIKPNKDTKIDEWVLAATTTDGGKTQTFTSAAGADLKKSMAPGGDMYKNTTKQVQDTLTKGGEKQGLIALPGQSGSLEKINAEQQKKLGIVPQSTATTATDKDAAAVVSKADLDSELKTVKARENYINVKYPLDLQAEFQDCIKFGIVKYAASGLGAQVSGKRVVTIEKEKVGVGDRSTTLGTITLPIPGGIVDQNLANWTPDTLDTIAKGFAKVAQSTISEGPDAGAAAAKGAVGGALGDGGAAAEAKATSYFTAAAIGGNANIMGRQYGAVDNPNMELLFSGPSLRSFSFTFKLSPRSEEEAKAVKTIIRSFKQAMSVKRTESTLLLKSPFTFAISYISGGKQHPYLNKFKECALTNCSVNYTPYGTYMTYAGKEKSMVAYELQLQFQELEPLFDDEYGNDFNDIGF